MQDTYTVTYTVTIVGEAGASCDAEVELTESELRKLFEIAVKLDKDRNKQDQYKSRFPYMYICNANDEYIFPIKLKK